MRLLHQLHFNLGHLLYQQGDLAGASDSYQQAIALFPDEPKTFFHLGTVLAEQGEWKAAIAAFQQAVERQPDWEAAQYRLGQLFLQQQQPEAALPYLQHVLRLNPQHPLAASDCASALIQQNQWAAALPYLQQAIALQPQFVEAFCQWASGLEATDTLTQARRICGQFLQYLQTGDATHSLMTLAQLYNQLGDVQRCYGGKNQLHHAERFYRQALQLQPDNLAATLGLGNCLARQRQWEQAAAVYRRGLAIYADDLSLHLQLAAVLEAQQHWQGAIAAYQTVLTLQQSQLPRSFNPADLIPEPQEYSPPQHIYRSTLDWLHATAQPLHHYRPVTGLLPAVQPQPVAVEPQICAGLNCAPCLQTLIQRFQLTAQGKGIYHLPASAAVPIQPSATYVAVIPQGKAWIAPQQSFWQVCNAIAILTPDHDLLADLSRDYPGQLPDCPSEPTWHRIFELESLPPLTSLPGTAAVLSGLSGHIYFHWMTDMLPRLELLRHSAIDFNEIDWFIVNSQARPFQRETLTALGVPPEKVVESDRHPYLQAERLIVPSFPGALGWMQPWALAFLRRTFLPRQANPAIPRGAIAASYPRNVYIQRRQAHYRRVINEADVVKCLQPFDVVPVELETRSLAEQVALFAQAETIVAPHGSGLTNLVFCRPGTQVIELFSPNYVRPYYWTVSKLLNLEHYCLLGEIFHCDPLRSLMYQNPLTEDIMVNLNALTQLMQQLKPSVCLQT